MPYLPCPGVPSYTPQLIRTLLTNPALEGWNFDPTLFTVILLALIVNQGGVIVDVLDGTDRSEAIYKARSAVNTITESIFGLHTHHLHFSASSEPSDVVGTIHGISSTARHADDRSSQQKHKPRSRRRSGPIEQPVSQDTRSVRSTPLTNGIRHDLDVPIATARRRVDGEEDGQPVLGEERGSAPDVERIGPDRSHTNDDNLGSRSQESTSVSPTQPQDHYDHRGTEVQALIRDTLPTWADILLVTGLEEAPSPAQIMLFEELRRSRSEAPKAGGVAEDSKVVPNLERKRSGMVIIWIRAEGMSDTSPSWVNDNFAISAQVDAVDLTPAPQLGKQRLIPDSYIANLTSLLQYTHLHPPLQQHIHNIISGLSSHPSLKTCLSGRFFLLFPQFVKAHRLLAGGFTLPQGWEEGLARIQADSDNQGIDKPGGAGRFGVSGGKNGVGSWARLAGEEPDVSQLYTPPGPGRSNAGRATQVEYKNGYVHDSASSSASRQAGEDGMEARGEAWYATPVNLKGVYTSVVRHRCKFRPMEDGVMWLLSASAADVGEKAMSEQRDGRRKRAKRAERRRREVDRILEEVLDLV